MKKSYVVDCETDALTGYTKLWNVVFREIETDEVTIFRNVHDDNRPCRDFISNSVLHFIGHNFIGFDRTVIETFVDITIPIKDITDTLVISRMLNYNQPGGHSLEAWGERFGQEKSAFEDFSKWSQELEDRCIQDTAINLKLYKRFKPYIDSPRWGAAFRLEGLTTAVCIHMYNTGFLLNVPKANILLNTLINKTNVLKESFKVDLKPKSKLIRNIVPQGTKKGTINSKDFRFLGPGEKDLRPYTIGSEFSLFEYEDFNPGSPLQRVQRLNEAGWRPVNKTKGHIEAIRNKDTKRLAHFKEFGWKTDEENLVTLPEDAPESIRKLKEWLLLDSRLGDLKEWLGLSAGLPSDPRGYVRIHGTFTNPGAWSMRVSHQRPNMANIPAVLDRKGNPAIYGAELRELWTVPEGYKLVGVDADSIQLRIFAHLAEDVRLIAAIEKGCKSDKSDIHNVNKDIIGSICKTREVAKTYIYALLLGAGLAKQASVLDCTKHEASQALKRILDYYPGWKKLVNGRLTEEGSKGYIECLDGRYLPLPEPRLALAGHLQSGEKIIMSLAMQNWMKWLEDYKEYYKLVNWVHDEWQTEVLDRTFEGMDPPDLPSYIGSIQVEGIVKAGKDLKLNIELAGNYKIGDTWAETH